MPEGDSVYKAAAKLRAALDQQVLTRTDFRVPAFATLDLSGQTVTSVVPRGKHLLIRVAEGTDTAAVDAAAAPAPAPTPAGDPGSGLTIHSHLKMEGVWQIYGAGERWRKPSYLARGVLSTASKTAVGFELGLLEVVPTASEDSIVGHLGPDLLGPDWDADLALANLLSDPARPVALALLDQRNLAGLGNVFANELSFLRGVRPQTPIGEIADPKRLVALAFKAIMVNKDRPIRNLTGLPRGKPRYWVHGRRGEACLRCGTRIESDQLGTGPTDTRYMWWCPSCQK
ncbi:endonuclease-8 [Salinibacterium amurskyense]|uniref:DNA-(apurinic or apyrimidinic site) lyase n=1 Tax=Salinibacterium amurskyense TaxID=205941 RepID=A0A2M9D738_9MICO|nr:DNA-formamidopyrimidine glycosylase family protein [Salinibacterium amurskyense]PJJ81470.1 endonuclease-8 [Salinibacterium amurskyense]RLQ83459.1 Fpg/Nei family DNA glycosylase [Salinibacterium amurskyense]GHD80383.1 putative endonuclease 8 2 [Salinibacterium amurskyense]